MVVKRYIDIAVMRRYSGITLANSGFRDLGVHFSSISSKTPRILIYSTISTTLERYSGIAVNRRHSGITLQWPNSGFQDDDEDPPHNVRVLVAKGHSSACACSDVGHQACIMDGANPPCNIPKMTCAVYTYFKL